MNIYLQKRQSHKMKTWCNLHMNSKLFNRNSSAHLQHLYKDLHKRLFKCLINKFVFKSATPLAQMSVGETIATEGGWNLPSHCHML